MQFRASHKSIKNKFRQLLVYIFVISIICQSNSIYVLAYVSNSIFLVIFAVLGVLLAAGLIGKKIKAAYSYVPLGFLASMIIFFSRRPDNAISLIVYTFIFEIFYFLFIYKPNYVERYLRAYSNVMVVIAVFSVIMFFLCNIFHLLTPVKYIPYTQTNWGHLNFNSYFNLYFASTNGYVLNRNIFGYSGIPNTAIFPEPPMFTYSLVVSLAYELFISKDKRKFPIVVFVVAGLTTFSTTFEIMLIVLLFLYMNIAFNKKWIKVLFVPLIIFAIFIAVQSIITSKSIYNTMSYSTRLQNLLMCFKCFLKNPVWGIGFGNQNDLANYIGASYTGVSSGLLDILAYGGLLWGIWYLYPLIKCLIVIFKSNSNSEYLRLASFSIVPLLLLVTVTQELRCVSFFYNAVIYYYLLTKNLESTQVDKERRHKYIVLAKTN